MTDHALRTRVSTFLREQAPCIFLLLPCAVLMVQLQLNFTNRGGADNIFEQYMFGGLGEIFDNRALCRWLIVSIHSLSGGLISHHKIYTFTQILFLWASLWVSYLLALRYLRPTAALAVPLLMCAFIPWGFLPIGAYLSFPYDFPNIFFCALGLFALVNDRFLLLCGVVAIGTLNKETVIYLVPAYFFLNLNLRCPTFWGRAALLGGVYVTAYFVPRLFIYPVAGAVSASFADNDQVRWLRNLRELAFMNDHTSLFQNVYWPWSIHIFVLFFYRRLHREVQRLYWSLPFFFLPIFLMGNISELRLYNEVLPLGALAFMYVFASLRGDSGISERQETDQAPEECGAG